MKFIEITRKYDGSKEYINVSHIWKIIPCNNGSRLFIIGYEFNTEIIETVENVLKLIAE